MVFYRPFLLVITLFMAVALCLIPVSASEGSYQNLVINADDTILGRITSITPPPEADEFSVTITRLSLLVTTPQPAKVGDTLLDGDVILLVPGAIAKVKFADRPESTLTGQTDGTAFVIKRGTVVSQLTTYTTVPTSAVVTAGTTVESPLEKRVYTIPTESGKVTKVTIYDTGGNEDYILRGGEKIPVKRGMEIKGGDEIFIVGKYSVELSNGDFFAPGTLWVINEPVVIQETIPEQGELQEFLQPFFGIWDEIKRGFDTFFPSGRDQ